MTAPFLVGFALCFLTYLAIGASNQIVPRLVTQRLGGNNADVGRLSATFALAVVLSRPLLAVVARRGVRTLGVFGAGLALAGYLLQRVAGDLLVLTLARALVGVGETCVWTAFNSLATSRVPEHRQAEAVSLSSVAIFFAIGIGPQLTEPLVKRGSFGVALAVPLGIAIVALMVSWSVLDEWSPPQQRRTGRITAREMFHPGAFVPGLVLALATMAWSVWANYASLRADALNMKNAAILFSVYSAVSLTVRLFGAKIPERIGLLRCCVIACTLYAVAVTLLGTATRPAGLIVGAAVISTAVALHFPSLAAVALKRLEHPSERTVMLSSFGMFFEVGVGLGGVVFGPIARSAGIPVAFRVSAVAPLLGIVVLVTWLRSGPSRA